MTKTSPLVDHATGMAMAEDLIALFGPCVDRIEIAGSLRRGSDARDIELVCIPKIVAAQPGLFGGIGGAARHDALDVFVRDRIGDVFHPRLSKDGKQAVGPRFKRLWYASPRIGDAVALDVFSVPVPDAWGGIFAIRTGPAAFSHLCVTRRADGGAMPAGMQQREGRLWQGDQPVPTPDEADWFAAIGIPCWEPSIRSEARLRSYLRARRQAR